MRNLWSLTAILSLCVVTSARASDNWIVANTGAAPSREFVVVDAASIRDRVDVAGFMASASPERRDAFVQWVQQQSKSRKSNKAWPEFGPDLVFNGSAEHVYEAAKEPSIKAMSYRVNCTRQTLTTLDSLVLWRDKPLEKGGQTAERAASTPADRQIVAFVCGMGSGAWGGKVPAGLGFQQLGEVPQHLTDYVWANVWRDGKRPESTYKVTQKEADDAIAGLEKTMEEVAATQRAAMAGMVRFHGDAARINAPASGDPASPRSGTFLCPNGPGPGEQQTGATQGGNGVASVPVCMPSR